MKKVCVIGWPIRHSRSPLIHNYWIQKYGLNSVYEKLAVEPEKAAAFISSIPHSDYIGCNVTIPHKELAFKSVKSLDSNAKRLGAVNTVYISNGVLSGTNTDGEGFLTNLKTQYPDFVVANSKVLIIGAGGAAKAIIGTMLDDAALDNLAAAASAACKPIDDKRGTIEFRTEVAGVLAKRAAKIAYARAGGK